MDEQDRFTVAMIDELLEFLPGFEEPGRRFIEHWTQYYPVYVADAAEFFKLAGQPWWMDRNYRPNQAGEMLYDDAIVQAASLDEIKTMLTFCVRSERFGDGNWGGLLADGRIQCLLRRLQVIRADMKA